MEMKLDLKKNADFKDAFNKISELSPREMTLSFNKDLLEVVFMDSANVAMIIFTYKPEQMQEYKVEEKEEWTIQTLELKGTLKRFKTGTVTFKNEADGEIKSLKNNKIYLRTHRSKDGN